jgi:hypothetical protein
MFDLTSDQWMLLEHRGFGKITQFDIDELAYIDCNKENATMLLRCERRHLAMALELGMLKARGFHYETAVTGIAVVEYDDNTVFGYYFYPKGDSPLKKRFFKVVVTRTPGRGDSFRFINRKYYIHWFIPVSQV